MKHCVCPRHWKAPQVLITLPPHPLKHGHHLPSSNWNRRASPETSYSGQISGACSALSWRRRRRSAMRKRFATSQLPCRALQQRQSSDMQPVRWIPTRQWWKPWRNVTIAARPCTCTTSRRSRCRDRSPTIMQA